MATDAIFPPQPRALRLVGPIERKVQPFPPPPGPNQAGFLTPLHVNDLDGEHFELLSDLVFQSVQYPGLYTVKAGYVFDFASIPRGLWNVVPKNGLYDRAAGIHDAAYTGDLRNRSGERLHVTKDIADALFLEAMRADGVNLVMARMMYWAVQVGGTPTYENLGKA